MQSSTATPDPGRWKGLIWVAEAGLLPAQALQAPCAAALDEWTVR